MLPVQIPISEKRSSINGCFDLKRVVLWGRMLSAEPCKACDGNDPGSGASGVADHGGGVVLECGYDMERRGDRT